MADCQGFHEYCVSVVVVSVLLSLHCCCCLCVVVFVLLLLSLCGCWCVSICVFIDSSKCYQNHHSRLVSPLENKFALPEISCSDILGKTYGYHSDALLWKAYATTMLTCCHGNTPCDSLCLAKFHPLSSPPPQGVSQTSITISLALG